MRRGVPHQLLGGADEARALQSARAAEPDLSESDLIDLVAANTGLPLRLVRTAIAYWAAYPQKIEALLEHAVRVESEALTAHERTVRLFRR